MVKVQNAISRLAPALAALEFATRPIHPELRQALDRRWAELPEHVKTSNQVLGRSAIGCEGTHGVFPKCNLTCSPCYHSAEANKVRIDGAHTLAEVTRQMEFFRRTRGPRAHAQLIGGEVSLLEAADHAATLLAMRGNGREPMSMTHGDFEYQYLLDVVQDEQGVPRFDRVSFAAHFDSLMRGRRGAVRPHSEAELNPFREEFTRMFGDLRREHRVRSYLAHNMTVTPANIGEVAEVTSAVLDIPFDMLSFQPAAFIGDSRRWKENFQDVTIDSVWDKIEQGAGQELPWQGIQFGDPRCNRYTATVKAGSKFAVLLDPAEPKDMAARDRLLRHYGGMVFGGTPRMILAAKFVRALAAHPTDISILFGLGQRILKRAGGVRHVARAIRDNNLGIKSFVVHNFMDASDVKPAWDLMQQGLGSDNPKIIETQERLAACMYTMSHPETGELVPACTQHTVLDPAENVGLRKLLPLTVK